MWFILKLQCNVRQWIQSRYFGNDTFEQSFLWREGTLSQVHVKQLFSHAEEASEPDDILYSVWLIAYLLPRSHSLPPTSYLAKLIVFRIRTIFYFKVRLFASLVLNSITSCLWAYSLYRQYPVSEPLMWEQFGLLQNWSNYKNDFIIITITLWSSCEYWYNLNRVPSL